MADATDTSWDVNYFQKRDEARLADLGYKQQLMRNLGLVHSFGVTFSALVSKTEIQIYCLLTASLGTATGITILFGYGLTTGGPATMVIGWIVVSFFNLIIGISMAEIVSAAPVSGGPYFWSARLAPSQHSAFASWITGWFNLLGQVGAISGVAFGLAEFIAALIELKSDYDATPGRRIGIIAAIIISWTLVNSFARRYLRYLLYIAISLNSLGVLSFGIAVLVRAPTHQPTSFVFKTFIDQTGVDSNPGWSIQASPAYVAFCGSLMAQFAFVGYDSSAHLAEETIRASWNAPIGLISSLFASALLGLLFILALLFSIQDLHQTLASNQPVVQILVTLFGEDGAIILSMIILLCGWNSGLFTMTSNSRLIFAFSRDRGLPYYFSKVSTSLMSPIRAVSLSAILSFCLALPSLSSNIAFSAVTSIATIGLLISYGIPILIGFIYYQRFQEIKGPFTLGNGSRPVALIAVLYIAFMSIILLLPTQTPVTPDTFNYSVAAVGVVLLFSVGSWTIMVRFFEGPIKFASNELLKAG